MPGPPPVRTARIELRVRPEFVERIEAWRASQPGPPSKTQAIQHLINLGLEAAAGRRDYRPPGRRRRPPEG